MVMKPKRLINDIIHLYTTGLCWDLAFAMKELTGLPVWIVCEADGSEVHAFVFNEDTSTAYDIRGSLSIAEVIEGPWENGKTIAPWTRTVSVRKHDVAKAKTIAKRYLRKWL